MTSSSSSGARILPFNSPRTPRVRASDSRPQERAGEERLVVALVTVTRFIGGNKVHAQVPVFSDEIVPPGSAPHEMKSVPELSELLADGAVEANSYLDRIANASAARPPCEFAS